MKTGTTIRLGFIWGLTITLNVIWLILKDHFPVTRGIISFLVALIITFALLLLDKKAERPLHYYFMKEVRGVKILDIIAYTAIMVISVYVRAKLFYFESEDYLVFYSKWVMQIREIGWTSFSCNIGDYSPLYTNLLTLLAATSLPVKAAVKLMPIFFDFILGIACVLALKEVKPDAGTPAQIMMFALVVLNPVILLDASAWGQCDSIYSSFCVLSLLALLKLASGNKGASEWVFVFYGFAICFKLQAILFLPFILLVLFGQKEKNLKIGQVLWIPILYLLSAIPNLAMGKSLKDVLTIYIKQTEEYTYSLSLKYYNFYNLLGNPNSNIMQAYSALGFCLAVATLGIVYYLYVRKNAGFLQKDLLILAAFTVLTAAFLMPSMHERYAFVGEAICLILCMVDLKWAVITLATELCTLISYAEYLGEGAFHVSTELQMGIAVIRLAVIILLGREILKTSGPAKS